MATVVIEGGDLVVHLSRWERIGSFHGDVRVPLESIRSARPVSAASRELKGIRAPGTGWPGLIALGTWRRRGAKDFVVAYRRDPGLVIELRDQAFSRLVISAAVPDGLLEALPTH